MKSVGIITFHYALNAGAVLQAYALQEYLMALGHEVEFIDYRPPRKYDWKSFLAKTPSATFHKWHNFITGIQHQRAAIWRKYLNVGTPRYHSVNEIMQNPPLYDIYIAGSDQIWNFLRELDSAYLLEFVPQERKKISYAASMGQCAIPECLHNELRRQLLTFDALSLRENSGVEFVNKLIEDEGRAVQTLDPTLLVDSSVFAEIMERVRVPSEPYICSYILSMLDGKQAQGLMNLRTSMGLPWMNLLNPDTGAVVSNVRNRIVSPSEWLYCISHSAYTICGSFHAAVFSILFQKPFVVIVPERVLREQGGNQRILSLLDPLGLADRCVYGDDAEELKRILTTEPDWNKVSAGLGTLRKKSVEFLKKSLK